MWLNPYAVDAYDGINLNPLEVVFVKVKSFLLQADWTAPKMSQTYDRWLFVRCQVSVTTLSEHVRTLRNTSLTWPLLLTC
ncbi:hypothetical protein ABBQ38_007659 [Trebouxia sp. C0009 RCD-2024]